MLSRCIGVGARDWSIPSGMVVDAEAPSPFVGIDRVVDATHQGGQWPEHHSSGPTL